MTGASAATRWGATTARAATLLALIASGCAGGCPGGGAPPDEPFPEERELWQSLGVQLTSEGAAFLSEHGAEVLGSLLGRNDDGTIMLDLDSLDFDEVDVVDLGAIRVSFRDVVLGLEADQLELRLAAEPGRLIIRVDRGRISVKNGVLGFHILADLADAACRVADGIDAGAPGSRIASVTFEVAMTIEVDSDGRLQSEADFAEFEVHDIGIRFPVDCNLVECQDGCGECDVGCPLLGDSTDIFDAVTGGLKPALELALPAVLQSSVKDWLARLGASADMLVDAGDLLGDRVPSLHAALPVRVLARPAPAGLTVEPAGGGTRMQLALDMGTDAAVHPCVPPPGGDPVHVFGPAPEPEDARPGEPYHVELTFAGAVLDQAIWSAYKAGVLCVAVTSRDLARLSSGSLPLNTGAIAALLPGIRAYAGPDSPVMIRLEPSFSPEDFPLVEVAPGDAGQPTVKLKLPDVGVGLFAMVDGHYSRVLGLRVDGALRGALVARPDASLEVVLDEVVLDDLRIDYQEPVPAGDLEALAEFASAALAGGLLGDGLVLPIDPANAVRDAVGIPVDLVVRGLEAAGRDQDWVRARVALTEAQAAVAAAVTVVDAPGAVAAGAPPTLSLPASRDGRALEYQVRVDHLPWTSFSPGGDLRLSGPHWRMPGAHVVRVRARYAGDPRTLDVGGWRGVIEAVGPPPAISGGAPPASGAEDERGAGSGCAVGTPAGLGRAPGVLGPLLGLVGRRSGAPLRLLAGLGGCSDDPAAALECTSTSQCPGGHVCARGVCMPAGACVVAEECCPGQVCLAGLCQDPDRCAADAAGCPGDAPACESGWCVRKGCASRADCPTGMSCVEGRCADRLPCDGDCGPGEVCHVRSATCRAMPPGCRTQTCAPGQALVVADEDGTLMGAGCGWETVACDCVDSPPLAPGDAGRFGSLALAAEGPVATAYDATYGDLVWLDFDAAAEGVPAATTSVDGLPDGGVAVGALDGYRGGVVEPGPHVGRFSALSMAPDGQSALVAYRDDTRRGLAVATRADGTWRRHLVDTDGDAGWYASVGRTADGVPLVAHAAVRVGRGWTELRLARGDRVLPAGEDGWTTDVIADRELPADPPQGFTDVPATAGLGASLAVHGDAVGIAWVDRIASEVRLAWADDGLDFADRAVWPPPPADGEAAQGVEPAPDVSLAIREDGRLLLMVSELLRGRLLVGEGPAPDALEWTVVHEGSAGGAIRQVGAFPAAAWTSGGAAVLAYQDPHENDLWLATRAAPGAAWRRTALVTAGAVGFHNDVVVTDDAVLVYTAVLGFGPDGRWAGHPLLVRAPLP